MARRRCPEHAGGLTDRFFFLSWQPIGRSPLISWSAGQLYINIATMTIEALARCGVTESILGKYRSSEKPAVVVSY